MRRAQAKQRAKRISLPAPVKGLYEYLPVTRSDPLGAEWLENFLPTTRGVRVRGGLSRAAYVTDPVKGLFPFVEDTSKFFASTADAVYDVSSLSPSSVATQVISGLSSGDWSTQQIGVSGGNYLCAVNGTDHGHIYDGSDWHPWVDETVYDLAYDALTADFEVGETATGGTSSASAEILGVVRTTATTGLLKLGAITGTFQDDETITSASGSADANGTTSTASSVTVSGVATADLKDVWLYRSRIFAVEKDTLKFWYLPVSQVGGTALDGNLAGVFRRGGTLLFGATWSLDAGDGLDDKCVFVSSEGEVAIYEGSDPSDAAEWALVGRYDIPKPTSKYAAVNAGGDLVIATRDGIVPLSAAIQKDPAALSLSAVSRPIESTWGREMAASTEGVQLHKWTEEDLLLTVLPESTRMLTTNLETGAWASQPGWYADCAGEYSGSVYIGRSDGRIYKLNDTGADDGAPFTAKVCFAFSDLGDPTLYKVPTMVRASFFASGEFTYNVNIARDYKVQFDAAPSATEIDNGLMIWGTSSWGGATWGGGVGDPQQGVVSLWRSVTGPGYALAPTVQITSGGSVALNVELLTVDVTVEAGGLAA